MTPAIDPMHNAASPGASGPRVSADFAAEFIRTKRAAGCSERTCGVYQWWLDRLIAQTGDDVAVLDATALTCFLANLRERGLSASTVHQAYRTLKTFLGWLVRAGALRHNRMADVRVKTPATLPDIPTADEVMTVWRCPDTFEGRRNFGMTLVMGDTAVRSEEVRRPRNQDLNLGTGSLCVRGKGSKDWVVLLSAPTLEAIEYYMAMRPGARGSD